MYNSVEYINKLCYFCKWMIDYKLFMLTKNDNFYRLDEQAVYDTTVVGATPRIETYPFHIFLPYDVEKGYEYFIVCDHYSRFFCTKAAKISFYKPEYVNDNRRLGKKKWILTHNEKAKLVDFLGNELKGFTGGLDLFSSVREQYNLDHNPPWRDHPELEIPEDLPMPDYMQLPEN